MNLRTAKTKKKKLGSAEFPPAKDHHYDALSVGNVPVKGYRNRTNGYVLHAKVTGRGTRLRGNINNCGIIITKFKDRSKTYDGFMTGDIVVADVPKKYKHHGRIVGRIAIRKSGYFDITTINGEKYNVKSCFCRTLQKQDGYAYAYKAS